MQVLVKFIGVYLILTISAYSSGGDGSVVGGGGGPGQVLMTTQSISAGPGGGGGGNGGPGSLVVTLKDAVDVRLANGQVLDVQELKDRFSSDVTKVGEDYRVHVKIPVVDFQNSRGEVRQIQQIQQIQN